MKIPTRIFRVEGRKGKFSVSKYPCQMVSGGMKYQSYWDRGNNEKSVFAYGFTREEALNKVMGGINQ
jgi:hypothetical protein